MPTSLTCEVKLWRMTTNSLSWPLVPSSMLELRKTLGASTVDCLHRYANYSSHPYICAFHLPHPDMESWNLIMSTRLGFELALGFASATRIWQQQCCANSRLSHLEAWRLLLWLTWSPEPPNKKFNNPAEERLSQPPDLQPPQLRTQICEWGRLDIILAPADLSVN